MSVNVLLECSCGEELHYKSNQPSNAVLCPYCGAEIAVDSGRRVTEIIEGERGG